MMTDVESVRVCAQRETARLLEAQRRREQGSPASHVHPEEGLCLPHVKVVPPHHLAGSPMLEEIRRQTSESLRCSSHAPHGVHATAWLMSVPKCLRHNTALAVQYLCMLVAIDFRHWAEKPCPLASSLSSTSPAPAAALAAPGERVETFIGFYTVVEDRTSPMPTEIATTPAATTAMAEHILYPEPPSCTASATEVTDAAPRATGRAFIRGSAAMMHMLREAVDIHGLHWYDPSFLARFRTTEEAIQALAPCFVGCEADGVTPMWMPATRERVDLLLSLRDVLLSQNTNFYELLQACDGRVFGTPQAFVPSLRALHPRYQDVSQAPLLFGDDRQFPILKLSQLTALALNEALPAMWWANASNHGFEQGDGDPLNGERTWLTRTRDALTGQETAEDARARARALFSDADDISICCDYQIPKALRAAGLLVYDDHLAWLVDNHILLDQGGVEEVAIRVATLISTEWLIRWLDESFTGQEKSRVTPVALDHALWYMGRYMTDATAKHHLCRTIMY